MVLTTSPATALVIHADAVVLLSPVDIPSLHGLVKIPSLAEIALVTQMVSMRIPPVSIVSTVVSANPVVVVSVAAPVPIRAAS